MDISFNAANARYAFGKFDRVTIDGMPLRLHMDTEQGALFTREDGTGVAQQFSHQELSLLGQQGRILVERDYFNPEAARRRLMRSHVSASALTGRALRRFTKKDAYCEAAKELHSEKLMSFTDISIKANMQLLMGRVMHLAAERLPEGELKVLKSENLGIPPGPRTLRRWLAEYDDLGLIGHLDAMSSRGNRGHRHSPEVVALMMKEVHGYMSKDKPTMKMIHEKVQRAILIRNEERAEEGKWPLPMPSRETVRRAIRSLDPYRVELARNGEAAARKKFRPVSNGITVTRPLERVEIDEWTVNVSTLLESHGFYSQLTDDEKRSLGLYIKGDEKNPEYKAKVKAKDRWTLTAAICCATRCIVGLVLSRNANSEAAVQVLEMITTNKGAWADAVGALTPWDMHGTPELLVFDGGAAFKSMRFRMTAEDLGVMWEMAMNGVPENRGTIERAFGTMATDFAPRLSGHTYSSIMEKGDADPEKRAALTLEDFTFALLRWVVDIYHNTPHAGLRGETPIQAWRRLSNLYGVTPPPGSEMMRVCFGKQRKYRLDKKGINILGVKYQSEVLQKFLCRKDCKTVEVRWHPKDIGGISVKLGEHWVNVPAKDKSLQGVAAQTWLTAVRHVKAGNPKANSLDNRAVREAIKAIEDRNEAAMAKAKLNMEDWSEERFVRTENKLFASVEFYDCKEPTKAKDELGREIPSEEELTGVPTQSETCKANHETKKSGVTFEGE
jgi:putative transposase